MMAREYGDPTYTTVEFSDYIRRGLTASFCLMTDHQLLCFLMYYGAHQRLRQVARAMGVTRQCAGTTLDRALDKVTVAFHSDMLYNGDNNCENGGGDRNQPG
jgi:hypothetical protein